MAKAAEPVVTPTQIEGPYWKPGSPPRTSLLDDGVTGERVTLDGVVRDRTGKPVAGVWVDVWQCDGDGVYDNDGYRLRGHQFTDESGAYHVETVMPGSYADTFYRDDGEEHSFERTPHIHVKVKPPLRETLTTQLYFPDEPLNQTDTIFVPDCVVDIETTASGKHASFDFVVRI